MINRDLYIDTLGRLWDRQIDQEINGCTGSLFSIGMEQYGENKKGYPLTRLAISEEDTGFTYD